MTEVVEKTKGTRWTRKLRREFDSCRATVVRLREEIQQISMALTERDNQIEDLKDRISKAKKKSMLFEEGFKSLASTNLHLIGSEFDYLVDSEHTINVLKWKEHRSSVWVELKDRTPTPTQYEWLYFLGNDEFDLDVLMRCTANDLEQKWNLSRSVFSTVIELRDEITRPIAHAIYEHEGGGDPQSHWFKAQAFIHSIG